jgi:hypothetical protein
LSFLGVNTAAPHAAKMAHNAPQDGQIGLGLPCHVGTTIGLPGASREPWRAHMKKDAEASLSISINVEPLQAAIL